MKKLGFLRYVFTLPADIVAVIMVLVIRVLWGARLNVEHGCITVTLASTSWPMRTWYRGWGGTTFCHAMMFAPMTPELRERVMAHELVHVEQIEARMVVGFLFGAMVMATGHVVVGLLAWGMSSILNYWAASLVAVLRGRGPYTGNLYERAAYDRVEKSGTRMSDLRGRS